MVTKGVTLSCSSRCNSCNVDTFLQCCNVVGLTSLDFKFPVFPHVHCQDYFFFLTRFNCLSCWERMVGIVFISSSFNINLFYKHIYHQQQINSTPPMSFSSLLLQLLLPPTTGLAIHPPKGSCSQIISQLCRNCFNFTDEGYGC